MFSINFEMSKSNIKSITTWHEQWINRNMTVIKINCISTPAIVDICCVLFLVCKYICVCGCLLQNNIAGVPSSRPTSGFSQYCVCTCVRFGCTRHASLWLPHQKKIKNCGWVGGSVGLLLACPVHIFGRPTHHYRAEIWVYLWCVSHPNICTGLASSGRVVWALVFWPDYLQFTDPTIVYYDVFPDPSTLQAEK